MNNLIELVKIATDAFLQEQPSLLASGAHEQAISHRIAVYLEREFADTQLNYDCEYNKHLDIAKVIELDYVDEEARKECGCSACRNIEDPIDRERKFRPDIVVHRRNSDENNLVVIEVKKRKFCPFDEAKLIQLTCNSGAFRYKLGVFIFFPNNAPEFLWYQEGQRM